MKSSHRGPAFLRTFHLPHCPTDAFATYQTQSERATLMQIRPYQQADRGAVVDLSLRAWAPVFVHIKAALDPAVYDEFYPDWRVEQQKAVEGVCDEGKARVWVADDDGEVAGFVAVNVHSKQMGEIYMVAVDPDHQRKGIGQALSEFACDWMKGEGIAIAMVETGCDPGHAPARRTYERAGFGLLPCARYFKKL